MFLETYTLEIFKSKCQSDATGAHCFAHLDQDVSMALPYLNSALGGFEYLISNHIMIHLLNVMEFTDK